MGRRDDWQRARRAAIEGQSRWRAERAAKDERCSALGVQVVVALAERDRWVTECEQRAGTALSALVESEGLTLREALQWCAGSLALSEGSRLRRAARGANEVPGSDGEPRRRPDAATPTS